MGVIRGMQVIVPAGNDIKACIGREDAFILPTAGHLSNYSGLHEWVVRFDQINYTPENCNLGLHIGCFWVCNGYGAIHVISHSTVQSGIRHRES